MTSLLSQIDGIEARLIRAQIRVPDLPVAQILISRLLMHLGRELNSRLDRALRPHGLNEIEYRALMSIHSGESPISPGELCLSLNQSPANITRITDVLVERGLLLRLPDPQDRRRLTLQITAAGSELMNTLLPTMMALTKTGYHHFSADELQQLLAALRRIAACIDSTNDAPAADVSGIS